MQGALDLGERGILVTGRLDRLGRDALDMQEVVALLLDHGVRIVSLKDGIDNASGRGGTVLKLLTNILAGFAEFVAERCVYFIVVAMLAWHRDLPSLAPLGGPSTSAT